MRHRPRSRSLAAVLVGLALTAGSACSSSSPVTATTPSTTAAPATSTTAAKAKDAPNPESESKDTRSTPQNTPEKQKDQGKELTPNEVVELSIADIQAFWTEEMPAVYGVPYEPITGGLHPYSSTTDPPKCGNIRPSWQEVAGNAFYCDKSDLVAWDEEGLIPNLNNQFGSFAVALVFAHEFGHAIQGRNRDLGKHKTIITEQQADCFAGAWTKHVADGKSQKLELQPGALEGGMAALIDLRDPPGEITAVEAGAHGTAFDRINAFQTGFDGGAKACQPLIETPLPVSEVRFSDPEERSSGGNLEPSQLLELMPQLLNDYWKAGAEATGLKFEPISDLKPYDRGDSVTCNNKKLSPEAIANEMFVCVPDSYVAFDKALATAVYKKIGDWGLATLLAKQWVAAVQAQNGVDDSTRVALLEGACFTGSFSRAVVDGVNAKVDGQEGTFHLSPGDLDEAVITFLTFSDVGQPGDKNAVTAFEKVKVFRGGFFDGEKSCLAISANETGGK